MASNSSGVINRPPTSGPKRMSCSMDTRITVNLRSPWVQVGFLEASYHDRGIRSTKKPFARGATDKFDGSLPARGATMPLVAGRQNGAERDGGGGVSS